MLCANDIVYNIDIMRRSTTDSTFRSDAPFLVRLIRQNMPIVAFLLLAAAGMLLVYWYFSSDQQRVEAVAALGTGSEALVDDPNALTAAIVKLIPAKPVTQRLAQSPGPIRIGIIAGHKGFDSGTECTDGLTEVQITEVLAPKVAARLEAAGVVSEILDEFDPRLAGYTATGLLSIHVDSCDYINELATGFKISGSPFTDSSDLSICVQHAYAEATKLAYHPNSVTPDMFDYHAFREIGLGTPAIIIEVGFLNLDRDILTSGADTVADGLAEGLLCFLER